MDERRTEIRVGGLVLVSLLGLGALLWLLGEWPVRSGHLLRVQFAHTGNVVRGAPVKLGGVLVGRVEKILLDAQHRDEAGDSLPVLMQLSIEPAILSSLRVDARVTVATYGPLGEPYLELYSGSANAAAYEGKTPIRGLDAPRLDLVANRISNFLESASRVLEDDPQALAGFVRGLSQLAQTADGVLADNRSDLRTIAGELAAAAKDLRALSLSARKNLEPGGKADLLLDDATRAVQLVKGDLPQISRQAQQALGGLAALSGELTPEDGKRFRAALERYAGAADRLNDLAVRGERLLARIEAGEGTAGAALKDRQLYEDLKALIADLRKHPWKMLWKN